MPPTVDRCRHRGRVLSPVFPVAATPLYFTGIFVQCRERALAAARSANDKIAIDQHRLGVASVRCLAPEITDQINLPKDFTIGRVSADQSTLRAQGINLSSIDSRGAAWPVAPVVRENTVERNRPDGLAGFHRLGEQVLLLVLCSKDEKFTLGDSRRGVADTDILRKP